MFHKYFLMIVTLIISLSCKRENDIYLFSTFREPATDGLYLAWSEDGYHWNDLGGPYLKPELVLKDNTRPNRNLRVAFSDSPLGPFKDVSDTFTRQYTEGPTVIRQNNEWLIYYEAYRERAFGAVKTTDFKTFTDITDEISLPEGHKHGTIFRADRKTLDNLIRMASERNY